MRLIVASTLTGVLLLVDAAQSGQRVARDIGDDRRRMVEERRRHNEALRTLFAETGIPLGDSPSNVVARTQAIELINRAIREGVALDGSDVTADAVAAAAGDYIGRYVLGGTNDVQAGSAATNFIRAVRRANILR